MNELNKNIPALTGLRAIAAFMVFFHHYNPFENYGNDSYLFQFFSEMHIGVTLFFFLSGFLITYRYYYLDKIDFKAYLINRFARIYPMYFILTTITFIVLGGIKNHEGFNSFKIYLLNISFLRGFSDAYKFSGIAQGWSLTIEEIFYFSAPLLFILLKKNKLYYILLPIVFLTLGNVLVSICNIFEIKAMESLYFMLDFTFFGRFLEFLAGIILAVNLHRIKKIKFLNFTYLGFSFVIICLIMLLLLKPTHKAYGTDVLFGKIINTILLPFIAFIPLFIGLIIEKTFLSKLLSTNFFQLLGKSSYVFYLIHMGIFQIVFQKFFENNFLFFLFLTLLSYLLYEFIEKPLNKKTKDILL